MRQRTRGHFRQRKQHVQRPGGRKGGTIQELQESGELQEMWNGPQKLEIMAGGWGGVSSEELRPYPAASRFKLESDRIRLVV